MSDHLPGHVTKRTYRREGRTWVRFIATIELPDPGGQRRRRSESFIRKGEADAWLARQRALQAQLVRVDSETPNVDKLLRSWLAYGEGIVEWSPTHLDRSRRIVGRDLKPLYPILIDRLAVEHVEDLLSQRQRDGLAPNSLRLIRSALVAALNLAIRRRQLPPGANVAALARIPTVRRRPPKALIPEQARQLIAACEGERLGPLYVTAMVLALRPSEALGLRWGDVDLDGGLVRIEQTVQFVRGTYYIRAVTKTEGATRAIVVPAQVVELLRQRRQRQRLERMAAEDWQDSDLIFTSARGGPQNERYAAKRLGEILERAGLPRVTFYQLRHTGATLMLAQGVPLEQVAEVMGHSSLNQTSRYAQIVRPLREEAARKMEAFMRGAEGE